MASNKQGDMALTEQKMKELRREVDETAGLMKDNIEMTIIRGEHIEELEERTEKLEEEAHQFEVTSRKVKKKFWWKNKKWMAILIGVGVGVLFIIILAIVLSVKPWQ